MSTLAETALLSAQSQIGVTEKPKGSNAGPEVEIYLKSVGLSKGYAWCMAFVFWNVLQASSKLKVANPLKKTGGVLAQFHFCKDRIVKIPKPGYIFIMDFGHGVGHTGFVDKILPNGKIQTIEGNTNDDGSREGYEVAIRIRKISQIVGFIKI